MKKIYFYFTNAFWLLASYILAPFLYFFIKSRVQNTPLKILVIPPVKIGDLVCATPIFREIKKVLPECRLEVLLLAGAGRRGSSYQLLEHNPYLDEIILPEEKDGLGVVGLIKLVKKIRWRGYDWSFVLTPGVVEKVICFWAAIPRRAAIISVYAPLTSRLLNFTVSHRKEIKLHQFATRRYLALLEFIGAEKPREQREIFTNESEEKSALDFLRANNLRPEDFLIGLSLTAGNKLKEWPKEKFAALADVLIKELGAKIIFVGGPKDTEDISWAQKKMSGASISTAGKLSVIELAALMRHLKIFISVDTGPLYMASAMGAPVVDIAGPIDVSEQPPLGKKCVIVQKDLPCVPCSYVTKTARFCACGDRRCIEEISVDDVFRGVRMLVKSSLPKSGRAGR